MSNLLINDYPLIVSPKLATRIGLYEAHFLQQIHWLCEKSKNIRDGKAWVYNTYEQWVEQFPFMERQQVGRIVRKLEEMGVLITTGEYNKYKLDKTKWYRVNYDSPVLDFADEPAEYPKTNDERSNMNHESSDLNAESSFVNAESSDLNTQLPQTFYKDFHIDFLQDGDRVAPAAPEAEILESETPEPAKPKTADEKIRANPDNVKTWNAYAAAYRRRYGILPESNRKTRGQVAQFVKLVGAEKAVMLAAYFPTHNGRWFVRCRHEFGLLLKSYQQIATDYATGQQMTETRARQTENTQANLESHNGALEILKKHYGLE